MTEPQTLDEAWTAVEDYLAPTLGWGLSLKPRGTGVTLWRRWLRPAGGHEFEASISRSDRTGTMEVLTANGPSPLTALQALLVRARGLEPGHIHDFQRLDGEIWTGAGTSYRCACGALKRVETTEKVTIHWSNGQTDWPTRS